MPAGSKSMHRGSLPLVGLLGAVIALGGCRIEHIDPTAKKAPEAPIGSFENKDFDPNAQVEAMWSAKVLPEVQARAGDFGALRSAMSANLDDAGAAHGHRERAPGAPWTMVTSVKGRIVAVDTESSAARIGVDTDGDGKADVEVQIGPVIRGTAIRDSLSFISFTSYANQIDFAQLATALNKKAYATVLKPIPRDALMGKSVQLTGVFTVDASAPMPLVTPLVFALGPAS